MPTHAQLHDQSTRTTADARLQQALTPDTARPVLAFDDATKPCALPCQALNVLGRVFSPDACFIGALDLLRRDAASKAKHPSGGKA